ncbi:hypothetical protein KUCAC02_019683, partial [Chaenocephalus aceratus]
GRSLGARGHSSLQIQLWSRKLLLRGLHAVKRSHHICFTKTLTLALFSPSGRSSKLLLQIPKWSAFTQSHHDCTPTYVYRRR